MVGAAGEAVVRCSVRALLIDESHRVLLLASEDPTTGLPFWFPPGGGIEPGESPKAALVRELEEEVGLAKAAVGPEVWTRHHLFAWRGVLYDQREQWFLCRVQAFEPSGAHRTATEVLDLKNTRWWTLPELAATPDRLTPSDLPVRLELLLREGPPSARVEVGV